MTFVNIIFRYVKWQELKRLKASIEEFDLRWELRKCLTPAPDPGIAIRIESAIKKSKEIASISRLDEAWRFLNAAAYGEIQCMDAQSLKNKIIMLGNESAKVSKWRYESIKDILKQAKYDTPQDIENARHIVSDSQNILDEYSHNEYFKIRLRSSNINNIMTICILAVALMVFLLWYTDCKIGSGSCIYFFVVLMGMLGGAFSVMQRYITDDSTSKIPVDIATSRITISRPFIGGASAFVTYVFFSAGFILPSLMKEEKWPFILLAFCFLSGFSERFIVKIADSLMQRK